MLGPARRFIMKQPAVSIVIPTYNHAAFLRKALRSVLDQSFQDWEAIVVNNFSEDDTAEVVASFDDPRIRLFDFRNNGIIAASRNHGIGLSRGEYIAFLDSDDVWYSGKLLKCVEKMGEGYDIVCHGENWVEEGAASRKIYYGPISETSYEALLMKGNCLSTSAIMVRKSVLEDVGNFSEDPEIVTVEDYDLWLRLAERRCRFAFLDQILGEYMLHAGNQSKAVLRHMNAELVVLRNHFSSQGRVHVPKNRLALLYFRSARALQLQGSHREALVWLFKSWKTFPFILRTYAAGLISVAHLCKGG